MRWDSCPSLLHLVGLHCQVVIKVFPAPSHMPFLLSCVLVSWESIHTPLPSVSQGEAPKQAVGTSGSGVHISAAWR